MLKGYPDYLFLDALLGMHRDEPYPPDFVITSFTATPPTLEIGASQTVLLQWSYYNNNDPDSQSINQGIGTVSIGLYSVMSGILSSTTTFLLNAIKNLTTYPKEVTVNFQRKRYWFVSADPNIGNSAFIYGDLPPGFSQEFTTQREKSNVHYDCTGGRYFYYMYPATYGAAIENQFVSNGFLGSLDPANIRTINFTNQSGDTSSYIVLRSNNLLNGNDIVVNYL